MPQTNGLIAVPPATIKQTPRSCYCGRFYSMMIPSAVYILEAFALGASASGPMPIYINKVPEYSSLAKCAEKQLSTIVRDMYSGCGNGSQTTSFACFCYSSSQEFNSIISTAVTSQCSNDSQPATQASSALDVFASYCS
jgi:hypothetical protein